MHSSETPLACWLPTLERARAELESPEADGGLFRRDTALWSLAPEAQDSMAAVILRAQTLVRERWQQRMELSPKALHSLRTEPAPSDPPVMKARVYRRLIELDPSEGDCTHCRATPGESGRVQCTICGGSAWLRPPAPRDPGVRCPDCKGGMVTCSVCDGLGRTRGAVVETLTDTAVPTRRVLLPTLPASLHVGLSDALGDGVDGLPATLRVKLDELRSSDPYRGEISTTEPDIQGFSYGGAFHAAKRLLDELREAPGAHRVEAQAWARPFLLLRYKVRGVEQDVAVWARDGKSLGLLSARAT